MKLIAYSLRDMKADNFHAPFFVPSRANALRLLRELLSDGRSDLGKYPQDFMLYEIGALETETGTLTPCNPSEICSALSALPKPDPRQTLIPGTEPVLTEAN